MTQNPMTHGSAFQRISGSSRLRAALLSGAALVVAGHALAEPVLPQGGVVAHGDVSIGTPEAGKLTIHQGSQTGIVNWGSFSIGQGGHVDIVQPSAHASTLNRVTGDTTSAIHGRLTATGQVHLVNPNGIFIGETGTVNAGAFVASTLNIADDDFVEGRLRYSGLGNSATVTNAGRVEIGRGGYAALLGGKVRNSGVVTVPYGRIGFGAGERITLDLSGDQFLEVALPSSSTDEDALIEHSGTASAEGGLIEMRAATARHAARHAINLSGVAEATSVSVRGGAIVLGGGQGGRVTVTGRASTRSAPRPAPRATIRVKESPRPPVRGGTVEITGAEIALTGAQIDASGTGGGGEIHIGGDFLGTGPLQKADRLWADAGSLILADALETGDGGDIVLWSEIQTDFAGYISARGGSEAGDGGFVEVSSRLVLNYSGLADRRAPNGDVGMLWLDPTDITINAGAGGEDTLEANLALGDVTLDTTSFASDPGIITINADIDWTANALTLQADDSIVLNGALNGTSGADIDLNASSAITLNADISGNDITLDASTATLTSGDVTISATNAGTDLASITINPDVSWSTHDLTLNSDDAIVLNGSLSGGTTADITMASLGEITFGGDIAGNDVTLTATGATLGSLGATLSASTSGTDLGAIAVNTDITWTAGDLTISADDTITLNGALNGTTGTDIQLTSSGGMALNNDITGDAIRVDGVGVIAASSAAVSAASFVLQGGDWQQIASPLPAFSATDAFDILSGATFLRVTGGDGSAATPFVITDIYGLQGIGGFPTSNFAFGSNIDASDTSGWTTTTSALTNGFTPIASFGGTLDGAGFVLSDLTSDQLGEIFREGAIFDTITAGGVVDLNVVNASINGTDAAIVAINNAGTVRGSYAGTVTAQEDIAGVVLNNTGTIEVASVTTTLETPSPSSATRNIGGIAATSSGTITVTGASTVTINADELGDFSAVGGAVGSMTGGTLTVETPLTNAMTMTGAYSEVAAFFGGLVGDMSGGTIDSAAAQGSITFDNLSASSFEASMFAGGVVGFLGAGTITDSSADVDITATAVGNLQMVIGGFAGAVESSATVTGAHSNGDLSAAFDGVQIIGGFVGENFGSITLAEAGLDGTTTPVIVSAAGAGSVDSQVGGFAGTNSDTLDETRSSYTVSASGDSGERIVGGHTGSNFGVISRSYTTSSVTASSNDPGSTPYLAGAFGGLNQGSVSEAYATGLLSATGSATPTTGFTAGSTPVTASFYDSDTTGISTTADGATPLATATFQDTEAFIAAAEGLGWDFALDWASGDTGFYPQLYSLEEVVMATPDAFSVQYGLTGSATTTGTVAGGPDDFALAPFSTGDTLDTSTLFDSLTFADETVGTQDFFLATSSLTSAQGATYRVVDRTGSATITPAPLTITATDLSKNYGETVTFDGTEFTVAGLFFSDAVSSATLSSTGAVDTAAVDAYAISISDPVGTGLSNYTVSLVPGTLSVDPIPATITPADQSKTYGETFTFAGTEFSVAGLLFSDAVTSATVTSDGAAATANVGSFDILVSDPVGTGISNYILTLDTGTFAVSPAPLTITADDQAKIYGEAFTFAGTEFTAAGLLNSDSVTSVTLASAGAAATAGVDGYTITANDAVGTGLSNYDVSFVNGTFAVSPAPLTITADDQTKTYGDTLVFDGTEFTAAGLLNSDSVTSVTLASAGAAATASVDAYTITVSDAVGTGLSNYDVSFMNGTLGLTQAALTITATDQIKDADTELVFAGTEFTATGLLNSDTVTSVTLTSDGAPASASIADSPFAIVAADAQGTGLGNYEISFVDGQLSIVEEAVERIPVPGDFGGFPIPDVPDTIDVVFGPAGTTEDGTSGSTTSAATRSPALAEASETLASVDAVAETLTNTVSACDQSSGAVGRYLACLSDALNDFADELDDLSDDLPPSMDNVAQIVRDTRTRIDQTRRRAETRLAQATTDAERNAIRDEALAESRSALAEASEEIRKSIGLIRAEDPELAEVQQATVVRVADAIDSVEISLARATGL